MKNLILKFSIPFLILGVLMPTSFVFALTFNKSLYVYTHSAKDISQTSTTLKGTVNPKELATKVWFEWGPSANGLIFATPVQNIGDRKANIDFLSGIGNLSPGAIYYYRAVAQNQEGVFYGSTVSFRTKTHNTTSSNSSSLAGFFNKQTVSQQEPALMAVNISTDKTKVDRNEELVLSVRYQNIGASDADSVVLKLILPKDIELQMVQPFCYLAEKNSLTFNLGRVEKDDVGTIDVKVKVSDSVKFGKNLETRAILSFTTIGGSVEKEISDTLNISVVEKSATAMPAAVGFFSTGYAVWFLLSVFLNLFLVFYIFYTRYTNSKALKL